MKICFIGNLLTTLVKRDYETLSKHFDVDVIEPPKKKKEWLHHISLAKKKFRQTDIVFDWLAGWYYGPQWLQDRYVDKQLLLYGKMLEYMGE